MCITFEFSDVAGEAGNEVGFVAPWDAREPTISRVRVREKEGHHGEPVSHHSVLVFVPMVRSPVCFAAVETSTLAVLSHKDAVVVVDPKLRT